MEDFGNRIRIQTTGEIIPGDVRTLADIGCGNGVFGKYLLSQRSQLRIMGVDRSEKALSYVTTEKKIGDVTEIPLPDRSFDCVTCLQVLEHIPVNHYDKALSELTRVSGKYVVISVPYREKLEGNTTQCPHCKTVFNVDLHLRSYDDATINRLLDPYGFRCVTTRNVVTSTELRGLKYIQAIKRGMRKKPIIFNSPICPICGYENGDFHLGSGSENNTAAPALPSKNPIKNLIKSAWPKKKINGYWIIALYQKE